MSSTSAAAQRILGSGSLLQQQPPAPQLGMDSLDFTTRPMEDTIVPSAKMGPSPGLFEPEKEIPVVKERLVVTRPVTIDARASVRPSRIQKPPVPRARDLVGDSRKNSKETAVKESEEAVSPSEALSPVGRAVGREDSGISLPANVSGGPARWSPEMRYKDGRDPFATYRRVEKESSPQSQKMLTTSVEQQTSLEEKVTSPSSTSGISMTRLAALRELSGKNDFALIIRLKEDKDAPLEFPRDDPSVYEEVARSFMTEHKLKNIFLEPLLEHMNDCHSNFDSLAKSKKIRKALVPVGQDTTKVYLRFLNILDLI